MSVGIRGSDLIKRKLAELDELRNRIEQDGSAAEIEKQHAVIGAGRPAKSPRLSLPNFPNVGLQGNQGMFPPGSCRFQLLGQPVQRAC